MDLKTVYGREFLPAGEDMGDPESIKKAYARLEALPTSTKSEATRFCAAWGEIVSAVSQVGAKAYWDMTRDTRDEKAEKEYARFAEKVVPLSEALDDGAKKRFLAFDRAWVPDELAIARERAQWEVDLFREANLPLIAENMKLQNAFMKIVSIWQTEFDGKTLTATQLRPYLEKPDRAIREGAWRARMRLHAADYEKLDDLFDKMLVVRKKMAKNADQADFAEFMYKRYKRLSYNREDSRKFRDAIRKWVVPAAKKIYGRRMKKLGLKSMRPWDLIADADGKEPPKVYKDIPELKAKGRKVLGSVDAQFAEAFDMMDGKGYLDLENRPGKAPGAYMNDLAEERMVLMFCNSVGTAGDFDTLMHEGGHAMHGFSSRHLHVLARDIPLEFAEVASMALELLARPYWDVVYTKEEAERIGRDQLEDVLTFLPFMSMLDEFQDWVYTDAKGEDRKERAKYWRSLEKKYRPYVDWGGLDGEMGMGWQYNHVYTVPLYYIEYGIAQVGAAQVFLNSQKDYRTAVEKYKAALSLGSTVGLPELFQAAGVKLVVKEPGILKDVVDGMMAHVGLD